MINWDSENTGAEEGVEERGPELWDGGVWLGAADDTALSSAT